MFSFISAWHFNMVAASHCSCFSQCVGRGQGSAAGAAEDHMTCMLDAFKCMGLFTYCVLCGILVFFVRTVFCMQFGTLTCITDVFSFISAWHFIMVAASHCSCFAQCVGRGQGSAAGATEDHMTCMLDALKCMGLYT